MPSEAVPRTLHYVGLLFLLTLASTFPWWAAAQIARAEYRRLLSALACSMRIFFYSICLLCILVALKSLDWAPRDPRDTLFGRIHLAGTALISIPSALRAFREKGARLAVTVTAAWAISAGAAWLLAQASDGFRDVLASLPRYLARE
jgi:hypothetical protein